MHPHHTVFGIDSVSRTSRHQAPGHAMKLLRIRGGEDMRGPRSNDIVVPDDIPTLLPAVRMALQLRKGLYVGGGSHWCSERILAEGRQRLIVAGAEVPGEVWQSETSTVVQPPVTVLHTAERMCSTPGSSTSFLCMCMQDRVG